MVASSASALAIRAFQIPLALIAALGLDGIIWPGQTSLQNNTSFDYIVVGCGTAGSIVATRLVENNNNVLVLEAGDDPPLPALFPGLFVALPKSYVDYDYQSTYDPCAASSQGNYTTLTAGKMLGGSASMNHLIHTRGCPSDFDNWAQITNDSTWAYENVLPYFVKSETSEDEDLNNANPKYHGTDGPMGVSRQTSDKTNDYLKSFAEVGHPTVLDLNADKCVGYTEPQFMIANQVRQTPALSYLKKVGKSPNLYLSKNTRVTRIIFEGNVAVGVEAVFKKKTYIFRANNEVILSAGVFNTPQLLMLSGIGHSDHLKKMNIGVKADLPVGDNYIEQASTMMVYKTTKHLVPLPAPLDLVIIPTRVPFPVIVGSAALNKTQTYPDYQIFGLLLPHDTPQLVLACHDTFWYRSDICDRLLKESAGRDVLYNILANLDPKSRGTIRLKSNDPFDAPSIKTGFLKDPRDLDNMVKYVKDFIKVGKSSYFKKIKAELAGLDLPECKNKVPKSDAFWKCYVRHLTVSPYHGVGTCAMGSVVDSNLRVLGFEHLRVVDASVMPVNPKGAPNAAVVAIAEKAVDFILNDKINVVDKS